MVLILVGMEVKVPGGLVVFSIPKWSDFSNLKDYQKGLVDIFQSQNGLILVTHP